MKDKFIKDQQKYFSTGSINRRQFIMSMTAAGITLPAALSMSQAVMAATPKKGGLCRIGMGHGSTTDTLDPSTYENSLMTQIGFTHGNCLTEVDNQGNLKAELAESYESDDAKTWVLKLRQGVEFHNGKTMTADDVIASLQMHTSEDSKSAAKALLKQIKSLKKDGDNTVIVELEAANADMPFILSDYHLLILPSKDGMVDPQAGVGTGGYTIEKFEPGVRAEFKRFANYWKEGAAHFDEIEMLALLDTTARQNAIMNGDVDIIDRVDPKTVALLARVPSLDILEVAGTLHYTFPMRLDVEPFGNYDLRMALKNVIKRQEMVDKILLGHGVMGNDHPISTANQFHNGDLAQREFNPEKAAEHYKKSGHSGPIKLSSSDAAFAGAVDAAQLIAASAKEAGIDIEVVREPSDGYWSNVWNKKGWCACYWGGRPTEDWMFASAYVKDTEWNDTAWRDTDDANKFNELVLQGRAELDSTKRRGIYAECQELLHNDGGSIVPMFANHIHAVSKKIAHDESVAGNWEMDGNKAPERWWFA